MRAALYMRLSRDDDGRSESASITTQRTILRRYAEQNGLTVAGEYVDDGYTGTNFDRPAWRRLTADIERGEIDCVLLKDLSRLGRNSARVNDLLDEFFPAHGVRCISVVDGYDSADLNGGGAIAASFLPVVHELYARDISSKIRSALRSKMEEGRFIGSFAPYGYRKDVGRGDKNRLVIDERTAPFVRAIFRMAERGDPPGEIAGKLNEWNVSPPAVYRETETACLPPEDAESPRWTSSSVCRILGNEAYVGRLAQGKTRKLSFKAKSARGVPREAWVRVDGTHEPL
ncbi:MAG: recombinase family protein, partial [Schwartzia sp.]|nr:recombinase family protein [Schwartzia sp. (in: firmicutes)]